MIWFCLDGSPAGAALAGMAAAVAPVPGMARPVIRVRSGPPGAGELAAAAVPAPAAAASQDASGTLVLTAEVTSFCQVQQGAREVVLSNGVASFGRRPTFDNGAPLLEIFLFDFKGDLYGQALDVAFIGFIREELKFSSVDVLIRQMDDDSARARAQLAAAPGAFPKLGAIG